RGGGGGGGGGGGTGGRGGGGGGGVGGARPRGRGVVDFPPYLREIKNLGIDGAVSIELEYSPEPAKIVEWVREAYESTDRLMRQVGLRGWRRQGDKGAGGQGDGGAVPGLPPQRQRQSLLGEPLRSPCHLVIPGVRVTDQVG